MIAKTRLESRDDRRFARMPAFKGLAHRRFFGSVRVLAIIFLLVACLFYGMAVAFLPLGLYVNLAIPLLIPIAFLVWALPENKSGIYKDSTLGTLLTCYLVSLFVWPVYLAIAIPGLPWITTQRLFLFPLAFILICSLSISMPLRLHVRNVLKCSPLLSVSIFAFAFLQIVTVFFSKTPADSLNRMISNQVSWTLVFVVSALLFTSQQRWKRFVPLMVGLVALLSLLAVWEIWLQRLPWSGHVPAFLKTDDRYLQAVTRSATGFYRAKGTTVHPLVLAELLALCTALLLHVLTIGRWRMRSIAFGMLGVSFFVIFNTESRLGMIGFFLSIIVYGLIWSITFWTRGRSIWGPAVLLSFPFLLLSFVGLSLAWNRLFRLLWGGGAQQASNDARAAQWEMLWPRLANWPLGYGTGSSGEILGYTGGGGMLTVDSYPITLLIDYGVIGFAIFVTIVLAGCVQAIRNHFNEESERSLNAALATMLCVFIVIKSVLSQEQNHPLIFMILGIIVARNYALKQQAQSTAANGLTPR